MEEADLPEHARIVRRLDYLADHGAITDNRKYRHLDDGIIEAKTRKGTRVLFFYDKDRVILCTSAFIKKQDKIPPEQLRRAKLRRKAYLQAQKDGLIEI